MMTLKDLEVFVADCCLDYAARGLEPGNPLDGDWEKCHRPLPRCEGGTKTVWLLKKDHAVHNVLQSEWLQRVCVYGWEFSFLKDETLKSAYKKWMSEKGKGMWKDYMGERDEVYRDLGRNWHKEFKSRDPEGYRLEMQRRAKLGAKAANANGAYLKGAEAIRDWWKNLSEEEKIARRKHAGNMTKEKRKERWQCLATGYISTFPGLSKYQNRRGIDNNQRIRIS